MERRCGRESHTRPKGLGALMNWGPEKMLISCSKESQHPAEWTPGPPVEHQKNKKDTTLTAITLGSKYFSYVRSSTPSHTQTLIDPFRTLTNKVRGIYFAKEVFLRLLFIASVCIQHIYVYFCMNQQMTIQHKYHFIVFSLPVFKLTPKLIQTLLTTPSNGIAHIMKQFPWYLSAFMLNGLS